MYKTELDLENETHKILCDFEVQMDHEISARRPDLSSLSSDITACVSFVLSLFLSLLWLSLLSVLMSPNVLISSMLGTA